MKNETVLLGKINGLFGVKGWVKVFSYTQPREKIIDYKHWYLDDQQHGQLEVEQGHSHKAGVVAKLIGIDDRDAAATLINKNIWVATDQLASLPSDEYYWYQLIGLEVFDTEQKRIGKIKDLMETGANDVLIVRGDDNKEHLIPYLQDQVVKTIDLENQCMLVDWDTDY